LLIQAKLGKEMWPYAVMSAAYIRNRCYNKRLEQTPYFALTGGMFNIPLTANLPRNRPAKKISKSVKI